MTAAVIDSYYEYLLSLHRPWTNPDRLPDPATPEIIRDDITPLPVACLAADAQETAPHVWPSHMAGHHADVVFTPTRMVMTGDPVAAPEPRDTAAAPAG